MVVRLKRLFRRLLLVAIPVVLIGLISILLFTYSVSLYSMGFRDRIVPECQRVVDVIFEIRNNTPFEIEYVGYSKIEPLAKIDYWDGVEWKEYFRPWCGFGTGTHILFPGERVRCFFQVSESGKSEGGTYRVGFIWNFKSRFRFVRRQYFTTWSGPSVDH